MKGSGVLKKGGRVMAFIIPSAILLIDLAVPGIPFSYSTLSTATKQKESRLKDLEDESTKLGRKLSSQKDILEELSTLRMKMEAEEGLLPASPEVPSILAMVSLAATGSGVSVLLVKPEEARISGNVTAIPVSITVAGGFHEVARFVSDLLNLPRLLSVRPVKLQSYTKGNYEETVEETMVITGFSLDGGPVPKTAPPAAAVGGSRNGVATVEASAHVSYQPGSRRDPFSSLLEGEFESEYPAKIPNINDCTLAGVVWGEGEWLAILEDGDNRSYIIREGDPVVDGYTIEVRKNEVIFTQKGYGETRTVSLKLKSGEKTGGKNKSS